MTKRVALIAIFSSLFIISCSDNSDSKSSKADTSIDPVTVTTKEKAANNEKVTTAAASKSSDTKKVDKTQLSVKEGKENSEEEATTDKKAIEKPTKETQEEKAVEKGTLLFFMNPNGGPCIAQNKIITSILDKLEKKVDVVYIKTDAPISRMTFNRYGVRRLPSIIVLNSAGDMHKQLPPGIHQENILLDAVSF